MAITVGLPTGVGDGGAPWPSARQPRRVRDDRPCQPSGLSCRRAALRKRSALVITEAELRLIAAPLIIGDSNQPVNGNNTPAASGTPRAL